MIVAVCIPAKTPAVMAEPIVNGGPGGTAKARLTAKAPCIIDWAMAIFFSAFAAFSWSSSACFVFASSNIFSASISFSNRFFLRNFFNFFPCYLHKLPEIIKDTQQHFERSRIQA
jgi:hypothetical protein